MNHAVLSPRLLTHPRDGRTPPRWAVVAAHLVALVTLPSGLWRVALVADVPLGLRVDGDTVAVHGWEAVYIVGLSVVCEGLALLTLGLVRPWGERAPSWLPFVGGRRVAPFAAVVPSAVGAVALAVIWAWSFRDFPDVGSLGFTSGAWHVLMVACYLPLLLWAPLLGAVTYAYYRRRCRD
ncbi:MAG: hypothetical protein WBA97_35865 [Actinophytocola sp.]|uniref:hypothetical protein n=1 Tax=Actinophytocola sp. TaxID=1872138 RepID=UPI003C76F2BA